MSSTVKVQVVMDIMCVWSYLGFRRLRRAVERHRSEGGDVRISFRPYQLAPELSTEGEPVLEVLRRKFGEHAVSETADVASFAASEGVSVHFDRAIATNTMPAHRLIAEVTPQGLAADMADRLFQAHFTDGLNVADPETLSDLAREVGARTDDNHVSLEDIRADIAEVKGHGVSGVPVFWMDNGSTLAGFQSEDALLAALRGTSTESTTN